MTDLPISKEEIAEKFGPHLKFEPPGGWEAAAGKPDKKVKTHCCFCGQGCGIILNVKNNQVVGFDPWEAFPFNEGKLCPKGIKRYMQGSHPDRLLYPLENDKKSGYQRITWEKAYTRIIESIQRIQKEHGKDSFAILSGVSLTNEKSYLIGKFARVALQSANLDYNGRLCMVSAGAGNKKAFGVDRAANSWADILETDLILCAGANVSECAPITTDYIWKARDRGARLIVVDPRMTPIARTADLFLPVRPGTDLFLFNTMLNLIIKAGKINQEFISSHTEGFEELEKGWKPEHVELIHFRAPQRRLKMQPPKGQWKRDRKSNDRPPRNTEMHHPAVDTSFADKALKNNLIKKGSYDKPQTPQEIGAHQEMNASVPQTARRRAVQPNRVPINNPHDGKQCCEEVGQQNGIKVKQPPGSDHHQQGKQHACQNTVPKPAAMQPNSHHGALSAPRWESEQHAWNLSCGTLSISKKIWAILSSKTN